MVVVTTPLGGQWAYFTHSGAPEPEPTATEERRRRRGPGLPERAASPPLPSRTIDDHAERAPLEVELDAPRRRRLSCRRASGYYWHPVPPARRQTVPRAARSTAPARATRASVRVPRTPGGRVYPAGTIARRAAATPTATGGSHRHGGHVPARRCRWAATDGGRVVGGSTRRDGVVAADGGRRQDGSPSVPTTIRIHDPVTTRPSQAPCWWREHAPDPTRLRPTPPRRLRPARLRPRRAEGGRPRPGGRP